MEKLKPVFNVMLGIMATGALLNFFAQFQATRPIARFISGGYE